LPETAAVTHRTAFLPALLIALASSRLAAQVTINLDAVIGVSGTNASSVDGVGNAINLTGFADNSIATTLTAVGSTGSSSFNFNTGFSDTFDRANSTSSPGDVIADMKHDSGASGLFILDLDNDGSFLDETQSNLSGFGLHADNFITFDLNVLRANNGLAAGTPFTLSGLAGQANYTVYTNTSGAIILDGSQLAVFDWSISHQSDTFTLTVAGSARYLTFAGLSGRDLDYYGAHIGFANVQLLAVPEPAVVWLLGTGLAAFGLRRLRRA
jgi:hypothetical protein